ncbi:MAG: diacylglycerol kinase family lipid kinase [Deltaproteobacteria bacterium]|nr:diacylglycerol kinase family lipid kinase [Deltaproteobacteria bacterium]
MEFEWLAIINPEAGAGRARRLAPQLLEELRGEGVRLEAAYSKGPGDAYTIASTAASQGVRAFLAIGGDGTAHEVINGALALAPEGVRLFFAAIPLGTGNSFLRDFGIRNAKEAVKHFPKANKHPVDLLQITHSGGTIFSYNLVGLGFAAQAGALTNEKYKSLGRLGYVVAVVEETMRLHPLVLPFTTNCTPRDERPFLLLAFCNSTSTGGGMRMAPRAVVNDGELDIIRIGPMPRLAWIASFPGIFFGLHTLNPQVEQHRAQWVSFEPATPIVPCMIDGEILHLSISRIEVRHHAIDWFV